MSAPFLLTALVAFFLSACATPALAQVQPTPRACDTRVRVLAHLAKKYGEVPVAVGVTNPGALIEILATPDGSTWTIIVTTPRGMSCLVAAGEGWRNLKREPVRSEIQW